MSTATVHHYYARYLAHPSGVTDSLDHWAEAIEQHSALRKVDVLCAPAPEGGNNEFAKPERTKTVRHVGRGRSTWVPVGLGRHLKPDDLLILHEGWVLSNLVAAAVARIKRVPYVIIPHGVYEAGIVENTRDFWGIRRAAERWALRHAAAVHVFYEGEVGVVRRVEPKVKRFIIHANGAPVTSDRWTGAGDYFLWIGRYDPHHKGLDNLVRSWSQLANPKPKLILAGPDFLDGRRVVRELVETSKLDDVITLKGRVTGEEKATLMREARAYVHPSRWESCSIMLLEMLAIGAPSVISSTIHAADELGPLGVVVPAEFEPRGDLIQAQLELADRSKAIGQLALEWVDANGSWQAVGPGYAEDISALLNEGRTA